MAKLDFYDALPAVNPYVVLAKSCGYRVFVRPGRSVTYCFYTDGKNIGYAQWRTLGQRVASVHVANRRTGTGFSVADTITAETLKRAAECFAPSWASLADAASVRKYANFDAYLSASKFNGELTEV